MSIGNKLILEAFSKGYYVDDLGAVFNKNKKQIKLYKGNGYLSFGIKLPGLNTKRVFVHRLQAFQKFKEKIFENNIVVRHLNNISTDNRYDNINIGTQSENMFDIDKSKRVLRASNPKHNHEEIIKDYKKGLSYKCLQNKYNITSKGTISFIINKSLKAI